MKFPAILLAALTFSFSAQAMNRSGYRGYCGGLLDPKVSELKRLEDRSFEKKKAVSPKDAVRLAEEIAPTGMLELERRVETFLGFERFTALEIKGEDLTISLIDSPTRKSVTLIRTVTEAAEIRVFFDPVRLIELHEKNPGMDEKRSVYVSPGKEERFAGQSPVLYLTAEDYIALLEAKKQGRARDEIRAFFIWNGRLDRNTFSGGCFAAGTKVQTPTGSRAIETLRPGELVLSANGAQVLPTKVLRTFVFEEKDLWTLEFSDGTYVEATGDHPFYVMSQYAFVEVSRLQPGDPLYRFPDFDSMLGCLSVKRVFPNGKRVKVYNIEVEGQHNYFSGGVLVHNKGFFGI